MEKQTILMIDDDPVFLDGYKSILDNDYHILTAQNIESGLQILDSTHPDVLLLDISLKTKKEGLDFLPNVRCRFPQLVIIMVTNWDSFSISKEALEKGANYFFVKSESLDEIKYLINQSLFTNNKTNNEKFPIAQSKEMKRILDQSRKVAATSIPVLITGETGTGKDVIANYIHQHSIRSDKIFLPVNCGALSDSLLESELFGYEKGAFTGAVKSFEGKFEQANLGTIFLDEIKDLSAKGQASLLRAIEQKEIVKLGSKDVKKVDVRILVATNAILSDMVLKNEYRQDLYYRLTGVEINIPPLKERTEDITPLAYYFIEKISSENNISKKTVNQNVMRMLQSYHYPGNVRELYHVIERALVFSEHQEIRAQDIYLSGQTKIDENINYEIAKNNAVQAFQKSFIKSAMINSKGNISVAAKGMGLSRQSLHKLILELGLDEK